MRFFLRHRFEFFLVSCRGAGRLDLLLPCQCESSSSLSPPPNDNFGSPEVDAISLVPADGRFPRLLFLTVKGVKALGKEGCCFVRCFCS